MSSQGDIAQQFIDGGVIPADLVGQASVSKVYVDGQLAERDTDISAAASLAAAAQGSINTHEASASAHSSSAITYTGPIAASNVKQAIDATDQRVSTIVAGAGASNTEILDARQPATGEAFPILGARLNDVDARLAETTERLVDLGLNVKSFGAIGDGGSHPLSDYFPSLALAQMKYPHAQALTDQVDWAAIQLAIDYGYDIGRYTIQVPKGEYNMTYPLLHWDGMRLIGDGRSFGAEQKGTRIFKHNHFTLNDGSIYADTDAVVILANKSKVIEGYVQANQEIHNIFIDGIIDFDTANFTAYGVVSYTNTSFCTINSCEIGSDISLQFRHHLFQSTVTNNLFTGWHKGFSMLRLGTSNYLSKCYVLNSRADDTAIAYELRGIYSSGNNLACDSGKGTVYYFVNADWDLSGVGCEDCNHAKTIVEVDGNSNVTINTPTLLGNFDVGSTVFKVGTESRLTINNGTIGDVHTPQKVSEGSLYQLGYRCALTLNNVQMRDKYNTRPTNLDINNSYAKITPKGSTEIGLFGLESPTVFKSPRQFIGSLGPIDDYNTFNQLTPRVIFLGVDNPYYNFDGANYAGSMALPIGTVFLTGNPLKYGCVGWTITGYYTGDENFLYGAIVTPIPIVLSGTTAERPVLQNFTIGGRTFKSLAPGQPFLDTTISKMIYRNVANDGWMDSNGTAV
jgi:hypothetical protein